MSRPSVARRLALRAPAPATVLVARISGARHLVAAHAIDVGATILELDGVVAATPDRYSVQIGRDQHLAPPADAGDDDDAYFWRYLNHACEPNAAFSFGAADDADAPVRLVAIRPIRRGGEITFDYTTTEWDMSVPFPCGCARCLAQPAKARVVRGYKHLTETERRRISAHVAPHVRQLARERSREAQRAAP